MYALTECNASVFDRAEAYHHAGLNILPLKVDGSKSPKIYWERYSTEKYPWWQARHWFISKGKPSGIAVVCGTTSGNLEVLDFDDESLFLPWVRGVCQQVGKALLRSVPVIRTPDNGRHVYYRCPVNEGNIILAADEHQHALIETRGQGGYAVAPGSPLGTHPTGRPYRVISGDLCDVPTITPEERQVLLNTARTFNRYVKSVVSATKPQHTVPTAKPKTDWTDEERELIHELYGDWPCAERPGDEYNATASWEDILTPHGWTILKERGGVIYWRKPDSFGKEHHATTGHDGRDNLYVFSSAAFPFAAQRPYSKFAAFALLQCDGDFRKAAKELSDNHNQPNKGE